MSFRSTLRALPLVALLPFCALADDDRVEHFQGEPAETLEEAVSHLNEGNAQLRTLLAGEITEQDMADIHELSYTLENAVARLQKELKVLGVVLEDVHLASEAFNEDTVAASGRAYLEMIEQLEGLEAVQE